MPRIFGERVMLREYVTNDLEPMRQWVNNPNITRNLSEIFLYPHSEKQSRDFLDFAMSGKLKGFVIAHLNTGEYIGQIDFVRIDEINGVGELGIVIGDENNHGKGYGTEALKLFLDFAFNQLRLNRVELRCWQSNIAGQKAYEKAGFVREGVGRQKLFRNGKYHDEYQYGILKSEWQASKV